MFGQAKTMIGKIKKKPNSKSKQFSKLHKLTKQEIEDLAKFPSENPNPVMRITKDGVLLYANSVSESFLTEWGCKVNQIVPDNWKQRVMEAFGSRGEKIIETEHLDRTYSFLIAPVSEAGYANLYGRDITEGKKVEEELFLYAGIVSSSSDMMAILDTNFVYLAANKAYLAAFGMTKDGIVGHTVSEVFGEEFFETIIKPNAKRCLEGNRVSYEDWFQFPAYGSRFMSIGYCPYIAPDGDIRGFIVNARDITDRKIAEESLQKSQKQVTGVLESIKDGFFALNNNLEIIYFNNAAEELLGLKREQVIGKHIFNEIFPDAKGTIFEEKYTWALKEKKPVSFEAYFPAEPYRNWYEVRAYPYEDGLSVYFQVITERKEAKEYLEKQRYYLAKAQEMGNIGTWELDIKKNKLIWTDENYYIFGVALGTPLTYEFFLNCVHPDDREYVDTEWKAALNGKAYDIEHRIIVDGNIKWVREKAELQSDEHGNFVMATGFTQDITDLKRAEHEREYLLGTLKAKKEELEHFVSIIRHDFGNLVLSIQAFCIELAKTNEQLFKLIEEQNIKQQAKDRLLNLIKDDVPSSIDFIRSAADQLSKLLEGLKQVASVGRAEINVEQLDMNKLIKQITGAMKFQLQDCNVSLIVEQLPNCLGDADQVKRVFTNLLTNAIKYLSPDTKSRIKIYGRTDENNSIYSVEDNGIGISPENLEKIFDIFYRVDSSNPADGEGLGLPIVVKILERLNGRIRVESELGKGSKFFVSLPRA